MITPQLQTAIRAAQDRKALELKVLNLKGISAFTDYFVLCSGTSSRHTQAIADAVQEQVKQTGATPAHLEGYRQAEWILLDYLDFVVHIFSEEARQFYDLERLWRKAETVSVNETEPSHL